MLIREDVQKLRESTDAHRIRMLEMTKWVEGLSESGNYAAGDPLVTMGRYVSKDMVLSDGPFIEAKESVGGYLIVNAKDIDHAVEISKDCPILEVNGKVEVRLMLKMEM